MPVFLSNIKTLDLFIVLAFLAAAWRSKRALQRKEAECFLQAQYLPYSKAKKYALKNDGKALLTEEVPVYPHQRVEEMVVLAPNGGLFSAKVFNVLESWDEFNHNRIGGLFYSSCLTFYGGLDVATALLYYYCRYHEICISHFCDAVATALMLACGIGKLGCHFSVVAIGVFLMVLMQVCQTVLSSKCHYS